MMPYLSESGVGFQKAETSYRAAIQAARSAKTIRDKVLALLAGVNRPMSTEQIAKALRRSERSVQPRTSELQNEGLIMPSGKTCKTQWGVEAIMWQVRQVDPQGDLFGDAA